MSRNDLFERLLMALHAAALDDGQWLAASALMDEFFGSKGNILVAGDGAEAGDVEIFFARFCFRGERREEREHLYFEKYHPIDERVPRLRQLPDSRIVPLAKLYTDEELKSSRTYNEFLRFSDTLNSLYARLDGPDGSRIILAVADPADGEGWSARQVGTIARMLPHLRQFVRVRHALADARALGATATTLLENTHCGVVQLDRRGRIVAVNGLARELLARGNGLTDAGGLLHARVSAENSALQRALARALPRAGGPGESSSVVVSRERKVPRLVLHVSPVHAARFADGPSRLAAIVLVFDPAHRPPVDVGLVEAALGLTAAESRVAAALAEGQTLRDIAMATQRSEGTVRWHLKQILAKHGLSRQAEVVQMVQALNFGGDVRR